MKILSREEILASDAEARTEEVPVPEWGGAVRVRAMSAADRDRFEAAYVKDPGDNTRARIAALTICDERGGPLFKLADVEALGRKSAAALQRVFVVAMRLNRISDQDIRELEGNSDAGPSGNS